MGKRVAFMKQGEMGVMMIGGSMAEFAVTSNRNIIPLSDDFSFEQAASFFVNPLTAIGMVDRCVQLKSKCCIVTAAASQIGRMILPLLIEAGITPIATVRKNDQAQIVKEIVGPKYSDYVMNTSLPDYNVNMKKICLKLKPSTCLEAVSGEMTGQMLEMMGFKSTLIIYGLLSDKPAGGIQTIGFLGKA